jgi:predicted restriction endonuclease
MAGVMDANDSNRMILAAMRPSDYMLTSTECDREAAHRWHTAHSIREKDASVRDKILEYLRENVGRSVTGEELRYVADNRTEWARRVRELRTEFGWPIVTQNTGREDLDVGAYILEADRQSPVHDRKIPDSVRFAVLERDKYKCRKCGWSHEKYNRSNPRHLELHHMKHHAKGGENNEDNLMTLCTSCHDSAHKSAK